MTTAMEFFGDFESIPIPTAKADNHEAVPLAVQGEEDRVGGRFLIKHLVDDEIHVANDRFDVTDVGSDSLDAAFAPLVAKGILHAALDGHDFEEGMIEKILEVALDEFQKVPKAVNLYEVGVVGGEDEVGMVRKKEVRNVAEMDEALECGAAPVVTAAKFVGEEAGGFSEIVNELSGPRGAVGRMMIEDEPVGFIEAGLEGKVADPGGAFIEGALLPALVVKREQARLELKKPLGKPLQKQTGH